MKGRIKATYAMLYDAQGNKLFSLQSKDLGGDVAVECAVEMGDKKFVPVTLSHAAKEVIASKAKKNQVVYMDKANRNGELFVKQVAFDWSDNKKKWLVGAALAGVALLLLSGKERSHGNS